MPDAGRGAIVDDHFFFAPHSSREPIYAFIHKPIGPARIGVVVVPPIGRERLRICQETPSLGRELARAGFAVIRFDYRGEGESGGSFCKSTLSGRADDAVAAAEELKQRTGIERVALVGFHLGAAVAVLAARRARADWLALCDPVCDTRGHARNLLRASIIQQSQYFGSVPAAEADVRAHLGAGGAFRAYGFDVAGPLFDDLERLDLRAPLSEFAGRSLITFFAPRSGPTPHMLVAWASCLGAPSRSLLSPIRASFSWTTRKRWTRRIGPLNDTIVGWLRQEAAGCEIAAGVEERARS
jgi:uncharacterized protein